MKSIVDYSYLPLTHWERWRDSIRYPFLTGHSFWEHPAASPLAKATRPTQSELDYDSDTLISNIISSYWVDDILMREGEANEELYNKAREIDFVNKFHVINHPEILKKFIEMRKSEGHVYKASDRVSRALGSNVDEDHLALSDFYLKVEEPYLSRLHKEFLILIINSGYEPLPKNVNRCMIDQFARGNPDEQKKYRMYFSEHTALPVLKTTPIDYRIAHKQDAYTLMIILYPSENIPHYLHDQMLYMNYLQEAVEHDDDKEKNIVSNGLLIGDTPDQNSVLVGIEHIGYYWT